MDRRDQHLWSSRGSMRIEVKGYLNGAHVVLAGHDD
jgi:hypothetical protein